MLFGIEAIQVHIPSRPVKFTGGVVCPGVEPASQNLATTFVLGRNRMSTEPANIVKPINTIVFISDQEEEPAEYVE
jgi:hypothetical protein